jgi:hypothetical protein
MKHEDTRGLKVRAWLRVGQRQRGINMDALNRLEYILTGGAVRAVEGLYSLEFFSLCMPVTLA